MTLENITKTIEFQESYFKRRLKFNNDDKNEFYHEFNPLHIYCRLTELNLEIQEVEHLIKNYEDFFYLPLVRRSYKLKNGLKS